MEKVLILFGVLVFGVFTLTSNTGTKVDYVSVKQVETEEVVYDFSEEELVAYIKELNIKFPHIVIAQAKLESGNFKSKIFRENNNLFGMKEAKVRISTNKGTNRGHAKYDSWKDCVVDYALYQATYLSKFKTEEQYYAYLADNYAENGGYIKLIKKIAKDYK